MQLNNNTHSKIADAIFYNSPISIFIVDNYGIIKSANKSAIELTQNANESIILKSIFDIIPKVDLVFPISWWRKFLYNNNNEIRTQILDKKGNTTPIKLTSQLNVEIDLHLIYITPLPEFIPNGNNLIKSEDELAAYYNSTSELICIINSKKIILSFNKTFEQFVQLFFKKTVNEGDNILDFIAPNEVNDFDKNFDLALNGQEIKFEKEVYFKGTSIWWEITYSPVVNSFDEIFAVAFILKNIDDRKLIEESLVKSEARFKLIVAALNEGWWDWDLTSNFLYYSPKWWKTIGYEPNELINIPNFWLKIVHPDDVEKVQFVFNNALLSNIETYEIEYRAKHKDGHFIPMLSYGFVLRDKNGKAIMVSGFDKDLTEQKRKEISSLANKQSLQIVQKLAFVGNYEIDLINFNWHSSVKTCEILGIEDVQITSLADLQKFIHPQFVRKMEELLPENFTENEEVEREFYITNNKTGESKWIADFSNIEFNENGIPVKIIGAIQDVTKRKKEEDKVYKSEIKYRSLIENMELGILEVDNDGIILKAYPKFCEIVDYEESELIGKSAVEVFLPKGQLGNFQNATKDRELGTSNAYETQLLKKNGELIDVIISGTPLYNELGKVVGSVGIHYNISDRKKTELELEKSFEMVSKQNTRLMNFSYMVSHNLRSHTGNIKSLLSLLSTSNSENEKEELTNLLISVSDSLEETLTNLNEVLSIQSNTDILVEQLSINNFINKSLFLLRNQIESTNAIVNNTVDESLTVNFNAAYFESVIYNLISNAIKYCKPNNQPIVTISSFKTDGKLGLSIADNGIGIDLARNGDNVFGMYKTFNGNDDARGIGLFITKNQIDAMGGNIEIESKIGVGTTFKITFK